MEIETIKEKILEKFPGIYSEKGIDIVVAGVQEMDQEIRVGMERFLETGEIWGIQIEGFSVEKLIEEHGMNEVAAFLTLDWIKKEPEMAILSLQKGHDFVKS